MKPTLLIVDDQANNLKVISSVLDQHYDLYVANSGERALKILEKVTPDLILLDVMMPEMDGFEVCQILKNDVNLKNIPIIFLTAKIDVEDIVKGFEYGAVDYISKPFNIKEVLVRINTHISLANAMKTISFQNQQLLDYQDTLLQRNEELIESRDAIEKAAYEMNVINEKLMQSENELKKSNEKLKQSILEKDKFFSIIAHDLKSPFSGLIGLLGMMLDDRDNISEEEQVDIIQSLHESTKGLYSLLENLLEWSRIQRDMVKANFDMIDLFMIANDTVTHLDSRAKDKKIELINNIPNDTYAFADYMMTSTVIRNLISNSIKFTNSGGKIEIGISENKNGRIKLFVSDDGVGMDQKTLDKLFKLSESNSGVGTAGERGTGLGLLLCKEFIELNQGEIWVESEVGKGSTFFFTLMTSSTD